MVCFDRGKRTTHTCPQGQDLEGVRQLDYSLTVIENMSISTGLRPTCNPRV
jgi:hypothetical protein